jgi:hypothetical protein
MTHNEHGATPPQSNLLHAVAAREGANLWLVLRIKYNPRSGFYILVPHPDRKWDAHLSYHISGVLHIRTHGRQPVPDQQRQPLTDQFQGAEHLGKFSVGHVGLVCDETKFNDVIEVPAEKLTVSGSFVAIDLVRPGCEPKPAKEMLGDILQEEIIDKTNPHVVVRVGMQASYRSRISSGAQ